MHCEHWMKINYSLSNNKKKIDTLPLLLYANATWHSWSPRRQSTVLPMSLFRALPLDLTEATKILIKSEISLLSTASAHWPVDRWKGRFVKSVDRNLIGLSGPRQPDLPRQVGCAFTDLTLHRSLWWRFEDGRRGPHATKTKNETVI